MNETRTVALISIGVNFGVSIVSALVERDEFDVLERIGNDDEFADDVYGYVAQCAYDDSRGETEANDEDFERMIDGIVALAEVAS